jgi:hypothetical protein
MARILPACPRNLNTRDWREVFLPAYRVFPAPPAVLGGTIARVDPYALQLFADLQQSGFRDLSGSRMSARIPVSRDLLNRVVADALARSTAPVTGVDIRPLDGDRFDVVITLKWRLAPALKVTVVIERQPDFPASPVLVLRWSLMGGIGVIASRLIASLDRLPPGIQLKSDVLVVDIPALAAASPAAQVLPFVMAMELHTHIDEAVIVVHLGIGE